MREDDRGRAAAPPGREQFYQVLDLIYLLLNAAMVPGLLLGRGWGVALLLVTAATQIAIYTIFLDFFAVTPEQRMPLLGLVIFHLAAAALLGLLRWRR